MANFYRGGKTKPFKRVYCIKGKQAWTYWPSRGNKCPCCNESVGIIWESPKRS